MLAFRLAALGALIAAPGHAGAQGTLTEALDAPGLSWSATGDVAWLPLAEPGALAGPTIAEVRVPGPPEGGYGFELGCQTSWLETTAIGPGTFAIHVRHNYNPYTEISLIIDGTVAESWHSDGSPAEPGVSFSSWRRLTAALTDGTHTIQLLHEFGCHGFGTLFIKQPAVQVDKAIVLPPLSPAEREAIEAVPGRTWLGGGSSGFLPLTGASAQDGIDALRAPAVDSEAGGLPPAAPWLQYEAVGPVTVAWWEGTLEPPPVGPWIRRSLFIPPGPHTFRWTATNYGQDVDGFSETPATAIPFGEAVEAGDRHFTQGGGGSWQGVLSAAAPDGADAAWVRVFPGQAAWLESEVEGPASLQFKTSADASIESGGRMTLAINDRPVNMPGPDLVALLPAGRHRVRWVASKFAGDPAVVLLDDVRIVPAPERALGDALETPQLVWTTGPLQWIGLASGAAPDGTDAAVPPALAPGESAWLETTVSGPGRLAFRWPLADQPGFYTTVTPLRLVIDDHQVLEQRATQPAPVVEVGPGLHTFRWIASGQNDWRLGVLDQVEWTPIPDPPRLSALDGLSAPVAASDESFATPIHDITHDGLDALRLLPAPGGFPWQSSPSLTTWAEGPGHLFFWWRPSSGVSLAVDGSEATTYLVDGHWRRGILFVPPGWRHQSWTVNVAFSSADPPSIDLDEMAFSPSPAIPLDTALPGLGPWRTSPEAPWLGLAGDFILTTTPSAHAPPALSSWLETDITGPGVVVYSASGFGLEWLVDGLPAGHADPRLPTAVRCAVYIPDGSHTLRWRNNGPFTASLATPAFHALVGDLSLKRTSDGILLRVPRPAGFADSHVSVQHAIPTGTDLYWLTELFVRIHFSEPDAVTFRLPEPTGGTRLWRASYAP